MLLKFFVWNSLSTLNTDIDIDTALFSYYAGNLKSRQYRVLQVL